MTRLIRHSFNPIITPNKNISWQSEAIFNCGVVSYRGKIVMLTRCAGEYTDYISRIGFAESKDGVHFKHSAKPVIRPGRNFDKWGCEDPRVSEIEGTFYITYVALFKPANKGGGPPRIALASTLNFKNYKKHGIISPKGTDARDAVLFSEKIHGKYVMLFRPFNWTRKDITKSRGVTYIQVKEKKVPWPKNVELPKYFPEKPSIWVAYSDDLINWDGYKVVMEPKEPWEESKIGSGPPPIKTGRGWLLVYHGNGKEKEETKYRVGAALLNFSDLELISRTKYPIFEPKEEYEINGHVKNVVFPTGAVIIRSRLFIYYGAADTYCCLATARLGNILKILKSDKVNK